MQSFFKLNRLIVFFIACGFFVLAFEIYLQHYNQLQDKKIMWTPIVFGTIGGIVGLLIALIFNRISYYLFFILMIISILVGILGLYLHNRWRIPTAINFFINGIPFNFEILTTYTPFLAPSAFIAMGGLGLLIAIYQEWGNKNKL